MRSQLTRSVIRSLLFNEPLLFRSCIRCSAFHTYSHSRSRLFRPRHDAFQKRTLFGFSQKPKRTPREPQLDPGLQKMMELMLFKKQRTRPPSREELIEAWKAFFAYKEDNAEPIVEYQARHALVCFRHLVNESNKVDKLEGEEAGKLDLGDLRLALKALTRLPNDKTNTHYELAKVLYAHISQLRQEPHGIDAETKYYISVLTKTGGTEEARDVVRECYGKAGDVNGKDANANFGKDCWIAVVEGFARENNEEQLLQTVGTVETLGIPYTKTMHSIMTAFYAKQDQVEETKKWYNKPILANNFPFPETVSTILQFCIRNDELEWCKSVFRTLLERNPPKGIWDIIFQWAAGTLGKGVEDVEHMMQVMIRLSKAEKNQRKKYPDVSTINGLVSLAISRNDPYLAERYIALGLKYNIQPNAQTFIHQLSYRVSAGDFTGAQAAYNALQAEEVFDFADLPAINQYIRGLCAVKNPNYDLINSLCSDLEERKARLEPSTVSALGVLYLNRGETDELIDTLQTHVFHYTVNERASIRDAFLAYCLDPATPTARAWDAYTIFRQIFDETDIVVRTQAMNEFFRRGRSDMALHVFGHMRAHVRTDRRPVLATYVQCLEGIALCEDLDSLKVVHNMLKMDSSIEPDTRLYNALMLAYTACGESDMALQFWDYITNSREGPSYRSLEIVLRACQRKPFGDKKARDIWDKMRRMEIEITKPIFVAYVGALAGQGKFEDAKALVEVAEKEFGFKPDVQM